MSVTIYHDPHIALSVAYARVWAPQDAHGLNTTTTHFDKATLARQVSRDIDRQHIERQGLSFLCGHSVLMFSPIVVFEEERLQELVSTSNIAFAGSLRICTSCIHRPLGCAHTHGASPTRLCTPPARVPQRLSGNKSN